MNIGGKSIEYWAVLVGMVIYAATRDAERDPMPRRTLKVIASALLAYGMTPTVAPYVGNSDAAAAVVVMAFGLILLDMATAVLRDKQLMESLKTRVRKRIEK